MQMIKSIDDPGDAGNGGGSVTPGGGGTLYNRKTLTIAWSFPSNSPNPTAFEVVAYTGTDVTDTTQYLFAPVQVLGTDRELKRQFFPKNSLTINASVRSVYV